jgi:hypothetical protein
VKSASQKAKGITQGPGKGHEHAQKKEKGELGNKRQQQTAVRSLQCEGTPQGFGFVGYGHIWLHCDHYALWIMVLGLF